MQTRLGLEHNPEKPKSGKAAQALSRVRQTAAQVAAEWELKSLAEDVLVNIQNAPPESPKALGALLREIAGQHFRQQATARKIVNTFIELIRK